MRTLARETAPQIVLRNCSKEEGVGGKVSVHVILVKGVYRQSSTFSLLLLFCRFLLVTRNRIIIKDFSAFLGVRRYKN